MQKEFFIFIGRSGSGKSTIADMLLKDKQKLYKKYNKDNNLTSDEAFNIFHISTGHNFRKFNQKDNYTTALTKNIMNNGDSMPEFLAIWNWSSIFINTIKQNTSIVLDGAPRRIGEAKMLLDAFKFYGFSKVCVIYLSTSVKVSKSRILSRSQIEDRGDDTEQNLNKKNKWFDKDVMPIIDFYKTLKIKGFKVIEIDADKNTQDVYRDLMKKL